MANLIRITRFGIVNAYLVREEDGFTVVDTMLPGSAKRIVRESERAGRPIARIVLTHAHGDHVGSLDDLAGMVSGAEVIVSERDARLLAKDKSLDPGEPQDKLRGSFPGAKTVPDRTVNGGDRVGSLEVIEAPGHTPGHIALLDSRDRTLICGDLLDARRSGHPRPRQPALPAPGAGHLAPPDRARERPAA